MDGSAFRNMDIGRGIVLLLAVAALVFMAVGAGLMWVISHV